MTITTNPARNEYTATAGQTVFNYTFKIYVNTDLNVYVTPDGQEANDATDITTDYVVDTNTIGDPAGGFITFNTPLNLNDRVTIVSAIPDDRTTDYQFNGDFLPSTVNNDFDRTVSLVKQLENDVNRTIQFQESQQGASALTLPAPIAGNLIKWKSDLSGFENTDGTDIGGIAQAVADAQAAELGAETAETNASNSATAAAGSAASAASAAAKIPDPSAGDALKILRVNAAETANEYVDNTALITAYDNSASGLTATNVKTALDELAAGGVTISPTTSASRNQAISGYPVSQNASPDTLNIVGKIVYAEGFNTSGEVNTLEDVNTTFVMGAGFESQTYYIYKDKGGAVSATEFRPLEVQDYSGVESPSDATLRTTARHFDYESSTGTVSASGEGAGTLAWQAFDKESAGASYWQTNTATNSQLQYAHVEPRVLKSWRLRTRNIVTTQDPRRFTIEGSNDGVGWTAIDSTYTSSDYTGAGAGLFGALQTLPSNTTPYRFHRINITANNGDASFTSIGELELNTLTPSDRFDLGQGKVFDSSGTEIDRVYLAIVVADASGNPSTITNYTINKGKTKELEVHGDLTVRGEIDNKQVAKAWVTFDGTQNPPLIRDSYNVADVVDLGTGEYRILFETPMDSKVFNIQGTSGRYFIFSNDNVNTVNSCDVFNVFVSNTSGGTTPIDEQWIHIQIFGGKD